MRFRQYNSWGIFGIVAAIVLPVSTVMYAADSPNTTTKRDGLYGAIDPVETGKERRRFLIASGVDAELTQAEFGVDKKQDGGFVRSYEKWEEIQRFDADKSDTLNWFEAEAYRARLRYFVMMEYDTDHDAKLTGEERSKAITGIGSIAPKPEVVAEPGSPRPLPTVERLPDRIIVTDRSGRRYDSEVPPEYGGEIDDVLGMEAHNGEEAGQTFLDKYDTNRNGQIDPEEDQLQAHHTLQRILESFDTNGSGRLDKAEMEIYGEFFERRTESLKLSRDTKILIGFRNRFDPDGDGQLTDEEERQAKAAFDDFKRQEADYQRRDFRRMDKDGDNNLSSEEMGKEAHRRREQTARQLRDFDKNRDGRIDKEEQKLEAQVLRQRWEEARRKADLNGDGVLDEAERQKWLDTNWEPY